MLKKNCAQTTFSVLKMLPSMQCYENYSSPILRKNNSFKARSLNLLLYINLSGINELSSVFLTYTKKTCMNPYGKRETRFCRTSGVALMPCGQGNGLVSASRNVFILIIICNSLQLSLVLLTMWVVGTLK